MAIKTDGTLWAWGEGADGRLGDGGTTDRNSPVQIGSLTTWSKVACGLLFSTAIKTDGTLWAWGDNNDGALGDGSTTDRNSPVQIGSLTTWAESSGGKLGQLLRKTDGTLWAVGKNDDYGEAGQSNATNYSSPIQIGSLTTWIDIVRGSASAFALQSNGTFWAWGRNNQGQLGVGNTTNYSSPVQVGSDAWIKLPEQQTSSYSDAFAIK